MKQSRAVYAQVIVRFAVYDVILIRVTDIKEVVRGDKGGLSNRVYVTPGIPLL
jgi:hypothetical protein